MTLRLGDFSNSKRRFVPAYSWRGWCSLGRCSSVEKTPAEVSIAFLSKRRGPAGLLISTNSKTANRTRVFLRIMASNGKELREGELSFLRFEISKHRLAGASDNGFWIHGFFSASKFPRTSPMTTV